uniref:Nucleotide-binding alpha-beta plait domain-containing protein n=1 Tax=Tanacetum cinerariifolium TaxID=118510 RepID=A0A6L2LPB8_TANCI|nr:nucleotide-binding alpha-beta plait domain-containing protein [Tanacetum cinerariifolium]
MGSYRSMEDDVSKISTSVFVTNFPDSVKAKDLFHSCKQYGHVVGSFIPLKKTKGGKRFGFVRFINVFNAERLVNNLCTLWIGRCKLHANIARFQRPPSKGNNSHANNDAAGYSTSGSSESDSVPAIVLDEECLYAHDVSVALLGRVKEFTSLSNIKNALINEGFLDIRIRYMGELWIMLEFNSDKARDLFRDNVGANSWFSELRHASNEFSTDGRIVWVEVEGVPLKLWSGNTFKRIASRWGDILDIDDQDNTSFHSKRLCIYTKRHSNIFEDFKIIFRGKVFWIRAKEVPGWVPEFLEVSDDDEQSEEDLDIGEDGKQGEDSGRDNSDVEEKNASGDDSLKYPPGFTPTAVDNDLNSCGDNIRDVNVETQQKGGNSGSILNLVEEVVKVGQTIGYNTEGCMNDIIEIIESQGAPVVLR